ncbi:hypothetical protein FNH22_10890 [Fulvivirga sp. M361]|uniref:hypothetical protein n=1 Tax=Fulvivirga sp. M361 TaxID=2594266 RepID=UPI00117AF1D3|nr:hypothetical protein [Fulvivirga sp. M361]TRX59028.1 hypothetical protein FNH22_10890 [Fulvivirga sp. M361]
MENKHSEKLDHLLTTKRYDELTAEEREWVEAELGGEEVFHPLSHIVKTAAREEKMAVSAHVRQSLVTRMKSKHKPLWVRVLNYKMPAYIGVLLLIMGIFVVFFAVPERQVIVQKTVTIAAEPVVDTVFIVQRADTVFLERIVEVPVYLSVHQENKKPQEKPVELSGQSLADHEEWTDLLVRMD